MNLDNYYWYFSSAVPTKVCEEIKRYALQQRNQQALTGQFNYVDSNVALTPKESKDLKKTRNSNILWMNDPWIYKQIYPFVQNANKAAGWNFKLEFPEKMQFTQYNIGQHYKWHCDSWTKPYNMPGGQLDGKMRKLSMTLNLSDPDDYDGGDLEFDLQAGHSPLEKNTTHVCKEIKPKGSLVVFPSFVWHRVVPVTRGTRHSLVNWILGAPLQ
tara:strand:+ start:209 stop:847 length:639 start_codon:yes stop_codon:yes gene_type:complete